ncbi:tRNA/rRNA methyltransferase SpoU family protein [Tieghemostelium lacteum]|uniref:tRNA (guanosine(18)-2'-O)-methyltransferase TARBP1 n=1 Tax=Tieghemostelium lacteum TaxID=361077 RepID=A0A151ZHV6_TIELA|nr:tRNA/rRNA methyltransferase SpoU family protein [Tieghemostelium lacteum]|eukprot:KYQ93556.1 tRNA/rRNA methyltransferase SpoU family protein [Tieghemostelium lacteum]
MQNHINIEFLYKIYESQNNNESSNNKQSFISSLFLLVENFNANEILLEIKRYIKDNNENVDFIIFLITLVVSILNHNNQQDKELEKKEIIREIILEIISADRLEQLNSKYLTPLSTSISQIQQTLMDTEIYRQLVLLLNNNIQSQQQSEHNNQSIKYSFTIFSNLLASEKQADQYQFYSLLVPVLIENQSNQTNQYQRQQSFNLLIRILNSTMNQSTITNLSEWLELLWLKIKGPADFLDKLKLLFYFSPCYFYLISNNSSSKTTSNILERDEFWQILYRSLIDKDSLPRKQGIYLLKQIIVLLGNLTDKSWKSLFPEQWEQKQWSLFLSLFEAFDETKSHLFLPVWLQLNNLQLSGQSLNVDKINKPSSRFFWISILYQRGFQHVNVLIRRRVIRDCLLNLDLSKEILTIPFHQFMLPLLKSMDSLEIVQDIERQQLLNWDVLNGFFLNIIKTFSSDQKRLDQFMMDIHMLLSNQDQIKEQRCLKLLLNICLSCSKEYQIKSEQKLFEIFKQILHSHPRAGSTLNTEISLIVLQLMLKIRLDTKFGADQWFVLISKLLSIFPVQWIQDHFIEINEWLQPVKSSFYNRLSEYLVGNNLTFEKGIDSEFYECISRILLFLSEDEVSTLLLKNNDPLNSLQSQLLLQCHVVKEFKLHSKNIPTAEYYEQVLNGVKIVEYLKSTIINSANYTIDIISTNEEIENFTQDYRSIELIIQLLQHVTNDHLLKDFTIHLLDTLQQSVTTGLNIKQQAIILQCLYQLSHKQTLLELIYLKFSIILSTQAKYQFNSTTSVILPKFIQYKWLLIESIISNNNSNPIDNNTLTEILQQCLETTDNITGEKSLTPIFNCMKLVVTSTTTPVLDNETLSMVFKQCYLSFSDSKKKPHTLISSFVNLLFNKEFFRLPSAIPLIKEYLKRVLSDLGESVKISATLLSHCCHIWSMNPDTLFTFKKEIIDLCLLTNEDRSANQISTTTTTTDDNNTIYNSHGYIIRLFVADLKNEHLNLQQQTIKNSDSNGPFIENLLLEMLKMSQEDPELSKREYSQHSRTNKMKCKLWRTCCSLLYNIQFTEKNRQFYLETTEKMWKSLDQKNHGNVRYLIQLFIINVLLKAPTAQSIIEDQQLVKRMEQFNIDYQISASLIIITANYLQYLLNNHSTDKLYHLLIQQLFNKIIPWTTDFHHAVRTTAQLSIYAILSKKYSILDEFNNNSLLQSIYLYLENNKIQKRLREKQTLFIPNDDPHKKIFSMNILSSASNTVSTLEEDEEQNTTQQDDQDEFNLNIDESIIPMSLLEISKRLIKDFQSNFQQNQSTNQNSDLHQQPPLLTTENEETLLDFQRRITPWQWINKLDEQNQILEQQHQQQKNSQNGGKRQSMIVVGSLIENTPNLAGLIRTCEIFNIEQVAIPNLKLLSDPQFQRVSVSAEKLIPVIEVTRQNMLSFVELKKKQGYTILGVEQTSQSQNLASFKFPEKSLLILGQEQHGIPAEYLKIVDQCIEIPQLGQIRSLNVHVSASILVWEYTQQQLLKNK